MARGTRNFIFGCYIFSFLPFFLISNLILIQRSETKQNRYYSVRKRMKFMLINSDMSSGIKVFKIIDGGDAVARYMREYLRFRRLHPRLMCL